ncbi:hypothetical protein [Acidisphaera sp. L21]|uniref:hypothetical protein n=1 Tax=Acidisphaera sp. L21 TaxID=1641851 RepID=UPI00131BC21E|nr:hypothetical protein [Acidisphaera sp. L21]
MPIAIAWTQSSDTRLLSLRARGFPWYAVAADLRVGRNAVIERARRLGLPPLTRIQPPPRATVERVDRQPLPPGHPICWQAITNGTSIEGEPYPYPVFL